jgi:hypothetical protein
MSDLFRYFNSSPEVIRLVVMMYVKYPLSLRNVEDLLAERGIDICHETVRFWWNRFGPMFAAEIRKKRVAHMPRRSRLPTGRCRARRSRPPSFGVGGHSDYRGDRDDASALAHLQVGRIQPQIGPVALEWTSEEGVVHNAGHMMFGPAEAFTPEQYAQQYDANVLGTQRVNRAALPHMRASVYAGTNEPLRSIWLCSKSIPP